MFSVASGRATGSAKSAEGDCCCIRQSMSYLASARLYLVLCCIFPLWAVQLTVVYAHVWIDVYLLTDGKNLHPMELFRAWSFMCRQVLKNFSDTDRWETSVVAALALASDAPSEALREEEILAGAESLRRPLRVYLKEFGSAKAVVARKVSGASSPVASLAS